jgi:putative sterol carrier protein
LRPDAPPLLLEHMAFMLGWLAKPAALGGRAVALRIDLSDLDRSFGLAVDGGGASLGDVPAQPDGVVALPAEAWVRLVTGRLDAAHTPASVAVSGDVPLETLRQVFPGF